jgi:filamentous hemagglutinin family protein
MNHVYRLVFNAALGAFVVVSEITKGRQKSRSGKAATAAAALLVVGLANAQLSSTALPQGPQLSAGQASVSTAGAVMNIQQSTAKAALNWQSFNIGSQATVNITQPGASSVLLNRVTGADPSQILGSLQANGQVFLVNPQGVMFGRNSRVNVGALVASSMDISDADFMAGQWRFNRGNSTATVLNQGDIQASLGGYVALLAPTVQNEGVVSAQRGSIAMAAGEAVTLSLTGAGSLSVQVDPAQVQTQIDNRQLVQAQGGQVVMTARAASSLIGSSINNSGIVTASSLSSQGGRVSLTANHVANTGTLSADGTQGGHVVIAATQHDAFGVVSATGAQTTGGSIEVDAQRTVMLQSASMRADGATDGGQVRMTHGQTGTGGAYLSGTLSADGANGRGGDVQITGRQLDLFGTRISATGTTGGGQLRVGGDYQGANAAVPNADTLDVNAVQVDVSATQNGTGGRAIFWSENTTSFAGNVDARGASHGVKATANGGLVEVSSRGDLGFGGTVQANRLLLDPRTLTIIEPGMGFEMTTFVDPDAATTGFGSTVYDVSNTNVLVLSPNQNAVGSGAGYVFQRNGTLVSALRDTGGVANWHVLGSDKYLVANTGANNGLGAVSYFNALTSTVNGRMSASNSLVGDGSFGKGFGNLFDLGGGYYGATIRTDMTGLNSFILQKGAWNFFKADATGTNLATGTVSAANSLVGSTAGTAPATDPNPSSYGNTWVASTRGDSIGFFASDDLRDSHNTADLEPYISRTLTSLGNGNWIMGSPQWSGNKGGVTFISPTRIDSGALVGAFGASNSLVGITNGDNYGLTMRQDGRAGAGVVQIGASSSSNYILTLDAARTKIVPIDQNAATNGVSGVVSSSNALLVSEGVDGITQLSSGDLVLTNSAWSSNKGYVRVVPYAGNFYSTFTGTLSSVSSSNSLIGSQSGDLVGASITETGGGYFLAKSTYNRSFTRWTNSASTTSLGALTYMSAASPVTGVLSAANSLLGRSNANAAGGVYAVGGVRVLSDGSYVVLGTDVAMSNGTGFAAYGAAGSGVVGIAGPGANSIGLYDTTQYSGLRTTQYGGPVVTDLGGGAWVISSPWLNPSANNWSGDPYVVWGSRTNIPSGQVTTANTFALQNPGSANFGSLGNGRFVVGIPNYGANATEGAVTVIDANSSTIPTLTSANALLGSAGDHLGAGIADLGNNRYAVLSPDWNGGYGAVTIVNSSNAATRLQGSITTSTSLIGSAAGDRVGSGGVQALGSSGVSALISSEWNSNAGAVTLFNTSAGDLLGTLSASNSLVGRSAGDRVGVADYGVSLASSDLFRDLGSGYFAMRTANWKANASDSTAAGAVTWVNTTATLPTGVVSTSNSLVGANAGDLLGLDDVLTDITPLFKNMGSGWYALTSAHFDSNKGAMTVFNRSAAPVGVLGTSNSLVNTSTATGVFNASNASIVQLGAGYALMTPTWGNNLEGAITYVPNTTAVSGAISSTTSLVGAAGNALGGQITMFTNSMGDSKVLLGSPLWNGTRGAATLLSNTNGLANTLKGTLTVDATNSFVGGAVGDKVSSGGFGYLGNDVFVTYSPDFGSGSASRTVYGAVTLGDSVTNALKGDVSDINSFFSSISGQSAVPYISAEGQTGAILSTGSEVGRVEVVQPVQLVNSGLVYADYGTRKVNMRPMTIEAVLNTGTNLTLQATKNINVFSPIAVNNTSGNGGALTLQTSDVTGAITIGSLGRITTDNGELTIASAGSFINNASASPFNTGTARWTVYANDPATSSLGSNLGFDFKEYGKTLGQTLDGRTALGANTNGVVFAIAPTLTVPTPNDSKIYDGTTALGTPYAISGLVGGDTVEVTAAYTSPHSGWDPQNWMTNPSDIVVTIGSGGVTSSVATGRKPIFGYINQNQITPGQTTFVGAGRIDPFAFDADVDQNVVVTKVYDGTDAAPTGYAPSITNITPRNWGNNSAMPETFTLTIDPNMGSAYFTDSFSNNTSKVADAAQLQLPGWGGAYVLSNFSGGGRATDYNFQGFNSFFTAPAQITPKPLTGGVTVSNKVYDGTTAATVSGSVTASLSGVIGSDVVTISGSGLAGAANFSDANAGTGKTVMVSVSGLTIGGADAANYTVTAATTTANITPKALTVTGSTVANKQFDGSATATIGAGTLSGFVGSETLTVTGAGTFASVNVGNNINVATTYTLANGSNGGLAGNYSLAPETLTGNITPAWLAVIVGGLTGSTSKVYDGSTAATLSASNFTLTGWVNGDGTDVTVTKTSGVFADKNVGSNKLVTVSLSSGDFAATSTLLSNYGLPTTVSGNIGAITAKALTASYSGNNKVYDALTGVTVSGSSADVIGSDVVTFSQSAAFADKNVGTGKTINISGIGLSGADAGNYSLQNTTATTTANITAKALTAAYTGSHKVYDALTGAIVVGSSNDVIGSDVVTFSQSAAFANKNVGTGKTVNVTGISLSGADAGNYSLQNTTTTTTANITVKALTAAYTANNKVYDALTSATVSGGSSDVMGSDVVTFSQSAAFANKNVGTGKTINVSGISLSGNDASNYSLQNTTATASADITAKALTASYSGSNKVYDALTGATVAGSSSDVIGSDVVAFSQSAAFANKNVGTGKTINITGISLSGADAANYSLQNTTASTTAAISRASLNVTGASAANKVYDATATAIVSGGSVAVLGSDSVTLSGGNAMFANKNVGTGKAVATAYSLSGTDAGNYTLVQASGLTADITAKALTAAYTGSNKVYDALTGATVSGSSSDVIGSDVVTFSQSAAFTNKNVGTGKTVNVTGITLGGADAANYNLQNTSTTTTANITPYALSISGITAGNKVYDGLTTATLSGSASLGGVLGSDNVSVAGSAAGAFADKNVGTNKAILVSGLSLSGTDSGNYSVGTLSATADITARALTAIYTASNKVYDATTTATVSGSSSDVIGSDVVTFSQSAAFANKNVGTGKTVNVTGISLGGTDAGNYSLQNTTASATADISRASLTVTGTTASNKVYDATTAATVNGGSVAALGSDSVTLSGANATFANKNVGTAKAVTTSYTLSGTDAGNYMLVQPASLSANITPATLSVTGSSAANKVYDGSDSATVSGGSVTALGSDSVMLTAGSAAFADKNAGSAKAVTTSYALTGNDATNYVLAQPSLSANITPKSVTISGFVASDKTYDSTDAVTVTQWGSVSTGVGSETLVLNPGNATFSNANAGNGKTVTAIGYNLADGSGGGLASNYVLSASTATTTANIAKATLTMSAQNATKAFSDTDPTLNVVYSGFVGAETSSVLTGVGVSRVAGEAAGNYAITPTASAANYIITPINGTFTVAPADQLVIQFGNINALYGSTPTFAVTSAKYYSSSGSALRTLSVAQNNGVYTVDDGLGTTASFSIAATGAGTSGAGYYRAGNHTITGTGFQVLGGSNFNSSSFSAGNMAISRLAVDLTDSGTTGRADAGSSAVRRTYDGTTNTTLQSLANIDNRLTGDTVALDVSHATGGYADAHAGNGKLATFTGVTLSGADASNYAFGGTLLAEGKVDTRALTWTGVTVQNRTYDTTTNATVVGHGVLGNIVTSDIGQVSLDVSTVGGAFQLKDAGSQRAVSVWGNITGSAASDYSLSGATAYADIARAQLQVTGASATNKIYDGTTTAAVSGGSVAALAGDVVSLSAAANANFSNKNVGTSKAVTTAYTLSGTDADNYNLVQASGLTANITPKSLTASFIGSNKVYDAGTSATVTGNSSDVIGSDVVTYSQSAAFTNKNVGTGKTINVTGINLFGADAGNYTLQNSTATTTASITPFALSIGGVTAANRVYDGTTAAVLTGSASLSGILGNDAVSVSGTASGAFVDKNVGTAKSVNVTGLSLTGADAGNYTVGALSATADITAKALTAIYTASNKVYDATTTATVSGSTSDVIGSDVVTFSQNGAFTNKNVGTGKTVNVTGISLSGTDAGNYNLQNTTASTTADISRASLNVTGASASNKVYDATVAATVTGGAVAALGGDSVTLSGANAAFSNKNVGTGKTVTTMYALSGADAANYALVQASGLTADITAKALSVAYTASNKVYDATTAASVAGSTSDVIGSDVVTLSQTATFVDKNVGTGKTVNVTGINLGGADAGNYSLQSSTAISTANITPKLLTISGLTVNSKPYDGSTAATLSGTPGMLGAVPGDVLNLGGALQGTFANASVGTGQQVLLTGLLLTGADAQNYVLSTLVGDIVAAQAPSSSSSGGGTSAGLFATAAATAGGMQTATLGAMTGSGLTTVGGAGSAAGFAAGPGQMSRQASNGLLPSGARGGLFINAGTVNLGSASVMTLGTQQTSNNTNLAVLGQSPSRVQNSAVVTAMGTNMAAGISGSSTVSPAAVPASTSVPVTVAVLVINAVPGVLVKSLAMPSSSGFVEVKSFDAIAVPVTGMAPVAYALPQDTFVHVVSDTKLSYSARQADGTPLPEWVRLNTATGEISLNPPAGLALDQLTLTVTAVDPAGNAANTNLQFKLKN